jgi:hypothetical protein
VDRIVEKPVEIKVPGERERERERQRALLGSSVHDGLRA